MKSIFYGANGVKDVELVTRAEIIKSMIEAKAYITRRFKEKLTVDSAIEEIKKIEEKLPLVMENRPEDTDLILNDIVNYITLKMLEKRKRVLETAVTIYSYIYDKEVEYLEFYGKRTPVIRTGFNSFRFVKNLENVDILPEHWEINDTFATKLGTYLYNKANGTDVNEQGYLKIEQECLSNKKNIKRNNKKRK